MQFEVEIKVGQSFEQHFFSKIYSASQWKQEHEKVTIVWLEFDARRGEIESH